MRVAVIEDDESLLKLAEVVLGRAGHDVLSTADGHDGADLIRRSAPDLVLLDVMLPGCDGFEILEQLAEAGLTDRIPIVLVSALVGADDRRRGLEGGAVGFLAKPYAPARLVELALEFDGVSPAGILERRARALSSLEDGQPTTVGVGAAGAPAETATRDLGAEEPLAGVLDLSVDAIITIDAEQRIVGFNRGAERLFGYARGEVLGCPLDPLLPAHVVGVHREHVRGFGRGLETARHMGERREIHGRRRDGSLFPAEASILKNVVGGRLMFTAVLRDVSERKLLIDELSSRALQQAAIAALGQRALSEGQDLDRFLQEAAETVGKTLSVDLVEVTRLHDERLVVAAAHGSVGPATEAAVLALGSGSHPGYVLEVDRPVLVADLGSDDRFQTSDPTARGMVSGCGVPIPGARRHFGALAVYTADARTFTEDDVHFLQAVSNVIAALVDRSRVEARLRQFLDAAPDATLVADMGGRVVTANPQAVDLLGYSVDQLVGMEIEQLVPARYRETHVAHRAQYRREPRRRPMGAGRELSVLRADGSEVAVDIMLSPMETEEGMLVVAAMRDVTERRRMEATREAFLRAVSHDLRTPLAVLVGFASLLAEDDTVSEDHRGHVERILRSSHKLERLLVDLLDLDRLGRGVLRPNRRPTDLAALVQGVVTSAGVAEHPVTTDVDPRAVIASVDPAQVERILENLLVNVTRHTPPGTPCRVAVRREQEGIVLTVADEGPGVPDEQKISIFDPFARGSAEDHSPGTGIGLSLVAKFAELHDGRAWVEDGPGGGASFHVLVSDG